MNSTITLFIYWSIALGLIAGGIVALHKGFALVMSGKGKEPEENKIEFLGMKASVGSLGSLVMITSFLWGWAAHSSLPDYKDPYTTISKAKSEIGESAYTLSSFLEAHREELKSHEDVLTELREALQITQKTYATLNSENKPELVFQGSIIKDIKMQKIAIDKLQNSLGKNDDLELTAAAIEVRNVTKDIERSLGKIF